MRRHGLAADRRAFVAATATGRPFRWGEERKAVGRVGLEFSADQALNAAEGVLQRRVKASQLSVRMLVGGANPFILTSPLRGEHNPAPASLAEKEVPLTKTKRTSP